MNENGTFGTGGWGIVIFLIILFWAFAGGGFGFGGFGRAAAYDAYGGGCHFDILPRLKPWDSRVIEDCLSCRSRN